MLIQTGCKKAQGPSQYSPGSIKRLNNCIADDLELCAVVSYRGLSTVGGCDPVVGKLRCSILALTSHTSCPQGVALIAAC